MKTATKKPLENQSNARKRRLYGYGISAIVLIIIGIGGLLSASYHYAYVHAEPDQEIALNDTNAVAPFPLGVDPQAESITENATVDSYFYDHLSNVRASHDKGLSSLIQPILGKLALMTWYQSLASASTRILVIEPGERKEQIALHFAKILGWTDDQKREFLATVISLDPVLIEGKFTPGTYVVAREEKPYDVALLVSDRFTTNILARYPSNIEKIVPLNDTLTIASLLEREAYGFEDMRFIAGIIWNRLFTDMKLQIDATLQYAKGEKSTKTWWPQVNPQDKYIESAYNTYKNVGLPPTPIANPSANAILAALNPRQTDCMYYFHDAKGGFHCTKTYEEHVALLKEYYGHGK